MTTPLATLSLIALLAVAGCQPDAPDAPVAPEAPAAETPVAPDGQDYVALIGTADGLTVMDAEGTETAVAFGTYRDEVLAALAPFLGAPDSESLNEECPAGPVHTDTWANGLSLHYPAGLDFLSLAGWSASGDDERVQTPDGVQLGTPQDILEMTAGVEAMQGSSLGDEYTVGAMSENGDVVGALLGESGGLVTELFAGLNCFAR